MLSGGKPLEGEVHVRGAKNLLPKIMVAALLTTEPSVIRNVADVEDVLIMTDFITEMGGKVERLAEDVIKIYPEDIKPLSAKQLLKYGGKSRIPILLCGPFLVRFGKAVIPCLGGCKIGPRPVNFHIEALQKLGAVIEEKDDGTYAKADKLKGTIITLDYPSVGTTEQVLLTSVLAEGMTELRNAAIEPEIMDLILVLQKMGAIISVDTDRVIHITGVTKLKGYDHVALSDRLESASWACAAVATKGRIFVRGARQIDMITFLNKLRQIGGGFTITEQGITFYRENEDLIPISLQTDVHPGFMTDWQQPFVVLLTQATGASAIHETVYEERFGYVDTLNKMGAKIQLYQECLGSGECRFAHRNYKHSAVIIGPTKLKGTDIVIPDLRGGFSYVIAALMAEGESTITNLGVIGRGYEKFMDKLTHLGADIKSAS